MTGCSSKNKAGVSNITLYWWRPSDDAPQAVLQDIVKNFQTNNPGVTVQIVLKDPRVYEQEALSALAASQNVQNAPDIFAIRSEDLPKYIPQLVSAPDNLFDLNVTAKKQTGKSAVEVVQQSFVPAAVKSVIFADSNNPKGKVYGLPMAVDDLALYSNKTLLTKAADQLQTLNKVQKDISTEQLTALKKKIVAPPKTWSDLAGIVPYITIKNGNNISQSAIALGTGNNVEHSYDILQTMMMQDGVQMTSNDLNSATFNLSQNGTLGGQNLGASALDFYLRFANPQDAGGDPTKSLYTWNSSMPDSVDAFESGQVAMMINYASVYRFIINEAPEIKNSIDVQPLPQIVDSASPTGLGSTKTMAQMYVETAPASRGDKNRQAAAWNFINYISSSQGAKTYGSAMKLPSALNSGVDQAKFPAFKDQKSSADVWYRGHKSGDINLAFIAAIEAAHNGQKTSQKALDEAATATTAVLQSSLSKWLITGGN